MRISIKTSQFKLEKTERFQAWKNLTMYPRFSINE